MWGSSNTRTFTVNSLLSPPFKQAPPFSNRPSLFKGRKLISPSLFSAPLPSPLFFFHTVLIVLINLGCKTSCGLIQDGLFMWRKFGFVFFPRLHDLQPLVLELFHFAFLFFMKNWYHRLNCLFE